MEPMDTVPRRRRSGGPTEPEAVDAFREQS